MSGKGEGEAWLGAEVPSPCIAGRIYRIVQTPGMDGKNLLKLLPVSKPLENVESLVQSPVMSDNAKGNVSVSDHVTLKSVLANSVASPPITIPGPKTIPPVTLIHPTPVSQVEDMKIVSVENKNPTILPVPSTQSNGASTDKSPLQKDAATSTDKNASYVLVNKNHPPLTVKSPALPSGHHLQIPAHAEVKTVPASSLPLAGVSTDKSSLQKDAASVSTDKNASYVLVNTNHLPVSVKSPVLPSGRHLQIPAHAEVKTVPASSLPLAGVSTDKSSLQKDAASVSTDKNASYVLVNKNHPPLTVKSPALPSGHHLQIPAHAEVKTVPASSLPLAGVSTDKSSLQKDAASVSTDKNASYVLVNKNHPPLTVKSPALPSGHHLQIPAHAEVKTVPASSLPPVGVSIDKSSLQKDAASVSTDKNASYVLVNTNHLPVSAKSPVLPSGRHLQIPAHAEVKTVPASSLPPVGVSIDKSSLQKDAASVSTDKNASYVLVNTNHLPVSVKSPVLPSGRHLQIPAHAEVKTVPASSLPPVGVSTDKSSLQKDAASVSTDKNASYVLVNTNHLPVSVKSPVLPSGRHLQIPAHAEVKTVPASSLPLAGVSTDKSSLQKDAASVSTDKNASYVLVNTNHLPVTVKSPVLPSGHHLQIPAHAEVKTVPASSLPPAIQRKILTSAASSASATSEAAKLQASVIYVSPVNTVKTMVSKPLQMIRSKPVVTVATPLVLTMAQTAASSCALDVVKSSSQEKQAVPMKWVVQENSQSSTSCLVPVKSSNNMVSKILKTLIDVKAVNYPASILPNYSNSLSGSQAKITSIKDNALVMHNGKVYLLTKRDLNVVSAEDEKPQLPRTDTDFRKQHASQLIRSAADNTLANQVVNLVLSKNKGIALNANNPKSCETVRPQLQSELDTIGVKVASTVSTSQHENLQISNMSQCEAVSISESIPIAISSNQKTLIKGNTNSNILQKTIPPKAAAALQLSTKCDAFKEEEEEQKIQAMNSSGMTVQIQHRKEQHRNYYTELRKKFGLSKVERVYLRKIPLSQSLPRSEATACTSSAPISDTCKLPQAAPLKPDAGEENDRVNREEKLNIKRKAKMPPVLLHTKRKKTGVKSKLNSGLEHGKSCTPCIQVQLQQKNPTNSLELSSREDSEPSPFQRNEESEILQPTLHNCENETSFHEGSFREDTFPFRSSDLEDTIRDEKISRLKRLLQEREAALEEIRKNMEQT